MSISVGSFYFNEHSGFVYIRYTWLRACNAFCTALLSLSEYINNTVPLNSLRNDRQRYSSAMPHEYFQDAMFTFFFQQ